MRTLLIATVAALALSVAAAPTAQARWVPDNPFDNARFSPVCVKQKHLSFQLRVVARRIFGRKVCIPRIRYRVSSPATVVAGYQLGKYWCLVANTKPGAPLGSILSLFSAARFCGKYGRGWQYVWWR